VRPLEVFTSTAYRDGQAGCGIVLRAAGEVVRVIRRTVRAGSRAEGAYRALLHGLWRARGTGARRVRVATDDPDVAEQLAGRADVPVELIGLYLQVRALLNAYRWRAVEYVPRERNTEAALAALEALERSPLATDRDLDDDSSLPLFSLTV
jgi:ribonuclease HI